MELEEGKYYLLKNDDGKKEHNSVTVSIGQNRKYFGLKSCDIDIGDTNKYVYGEYLEEAVDGYIKILEEESALLISLIDDLKNKDMLVIDVDYANNPIEGRQVTSMKEIYRKDNETKKTMENTPYYLR